ncbi:hypothetical protein GQ602_003208 [Ophiocordyceps camponoti-floridani]|uniref:Uncharacterized protein n=1 Tax=Ophiocordyceps camponoti-floridani TaxID=2030778 RepID=A0A8H4VE13_9HYPO|nr:hypothetical protein GQ602_003208 [Ophiocordyceps camponoti-floridani]
MAPTRRPAKSKPGGVSATLSRQEPPSPFKRPPEVLQSFIAGLAERHIYVTHIDSKPASFKRNIFLVPVAMNICISLVFVWRMYAVLPWYWQLVLSALGHTSEATFAADKSSWSELALEIGRRGLTMFIDFVLFVFVWPWPVDFAAGRRHGNPMLWRRRVGFRDKEIYVRRSRVWDEAVDDAVADPDSRKIVAAYIHQATSPMLQEQKTGYLLMDSSWDLDWEAMVHAHALVDRKHVALEAFRNVVLLHHREYGWLCYDLKAGAEADSEDKRRQVFAFREALTSLGKEDLFYRWVETVQFETTQPGGFDAAQQETTAKKIREMFKAEGIEFEELWKEVTGGKEALGDTETTE